MASAILAGLHAVDAGAANTRTWISGKGTDQASCGPIAAPCRTLQYAHDNTNSGGEIDVLDGAGYGSLTITKAISIVNDGAGVAGVLSPASGNAITINANANDTIILRGLTIEGSNVGLHGVEFNSGAGLSLSNSSVQGFTAQPQTSFAVGTGVVLNSGQTGTPRFDIVNTAIENNLNGVDVTNATSTQAYITMDRVRVSSNSDTGIRFTSNATSTWVSIRKSTISFNQYGIYLYNYVNALLDDCAVNQNTLGLRSQNGSFYLSRSTLSGNGTPTQEPVYSYGDNKLNHNNNGHATITTFPTQ